MCSLCYTALKAIKEHQSIPARPYNALEIHRLYATKRDNVVTSYTVYYTQLSVAIENVNKHDMWNIMYTYWLHLHALRSCLSQHNSDIIPQIAVLSISGFDQWWDRVVRQTL